MQDLVNSFNPHPANRPGDAGVMRVFVEEYEVSIRTRPTGRVMPGQRVGETDTVKFQSAPGQPAG